MRSVFIFVWLLILIGCGVLPEDKNPAPIDSNFYSYHLDLCGQRSYGLSGCSYNKDENLQDKNVSFILPSEGKYTLRSSGCNYEVSSTYKDTQIKTVNFKDLLKDKPDARLTCTFSLTVFPKGFDKAMQAKFLIYNQEEFGVAEAKIFDREFKKGAGWLQIRQGGNRDTSIEFKTKDKGTFYYQGCGVQSSVEYDGDFIVSIDDILKVLPTDPSSSCNYSMFLVSQDRKDIRAFMFMLSIYDKAFLKLENMQSDYNGKKLCVEYEDVVGIVGINNEFKASNKKCEKIEDEFAWVWAATANGRTNLLGIKQGSILWEPLVK